MNQTARSAVNAASRSTTTGSPYNQAGTRMSMIPAIHAQSAGDQMHVVRPRVELVDRLEPGEVTEHDTVRVQRSLRTPVVPEV